MDKDFVISAVSPETKSFTTQHGTFTKYYIKLEGDGNPVQLVQKPTTPEPTVGQKLFGHLEPTPHGLKFKKASQFDSPSQPTVSVSSGFTDEDRKLLKEIHEMVCGKEVKDTVVEDFDDSKDVDLSGIPF